CNDNQITIYDDLSNSDEEKISFLIQKGIKFIKGDVLDFQKLVESSKNFELVIHLAAKSDVAESIIYPQDTINVNVNGTINVLKCCVQNNIKKIIFASSAAVYGNCNKLITEKSKTEPLSPYGKSKLDAEEQIRKFAKDGLIAISLRIFNVYGKGQNVQYAGVISKFLKNISEGKPLVIYGDGNQTRDFVSVYDVVDAFECAIKSDKNETYNIASGVSISINELVEIMFDVFGKKVEIRYSEKQKGDIRNSIVDIMLAKKELCFNPSRLLKKELAKF
ncbi:MAG: NAD-dependent epimerase/dehydratase family protein, partial [Nitrosopumilaceae archaeon]